MDQAPSLAVSAFPAPPPHWRLFGPSSGNVHVAPPRPPEEQVTIFGRKHGLGPPGQGGGAAAPEEPDEWMYDPGARDIAAELLQLHEVLQSTSVQLLESITSSAPDEYPRLLRQLTQVMRNQAHVLHQVRERETRAMVLARLKEQVRQKHFLARASEGSLAQLEARLVNVLGEGAVPPPPPPAQRPPPLQLPEPVLRPELPSLAKRWPADLMEPHSPDDAAAFAAAAVATACAGGHDDRGAEVAAMIVDDDSDVDPAAGGAAVPFFPVPAPAPPPPAGVAAPAPDQRDEGSRHGSKRRRIVVD